MLSSAETTNDSLALWMVARKRSDTEHPSKTIGSRM